MNKSVILNTDSYKLSHYLQYPPNTTMVNSYVESRGGRWNMMVYFGLQIFLKEYLSKPITKEDIDYAEQFVNSHVPGLTFNREGWEYILNKHGGYLPIIIESIPEGTVLPVSNALVQVRNTDPHVPWLTSYLETAILRAVWYPSEVATNSYMCKQVIKTYLDLTGDPSTIDFRLHDFGSRGVSSFESAGIGACAHLLNFKGTDTMTGILYAKEYYNAKEFPGFSIPASEHSTITSWGRENEIPAYQNMLDKFGGENKIFACVIDSYDAFSAITSWSTMRTKIESSGGTVVLRPDSGNPVAMATNCIEKMMYLFGYTINSKGYRVLPSYLRLIYGDGINEKSIGDILRACQMQKISADNISFGMGGALLQHLDRDTLRFAMKCSAVERDGKEYDVQKDPITDPNKKSKPGILAVVNSNEFGWRTCRRSELPTEDYTDLLQPVYKNGELLKDYTFEEVRYQVNSSL